MTATTALTAQNTQGVNDIHLTPPDFVRKQIDASVSDIGVDVVKTGLLTSLLLNSFILLILRHGLTLIWERNAGFGGDHQSCCGHSF